MTRSNPIQFSAGRRVTLAFRARWWYVDNPTGSTVYLREGNTDVPSGIASADMFVPALSARVIPCNASEFGLGFGVPVSTAPAGLPTSAVALFGDESEPMPSIGSEAALSTVVSGTVTNLPPPSSLLDSRSFASAGAKSYSVPLPAGTTGVLLYIVSNTHGLFSDLTVTGAGGLLYFGGKTAPLSDEFPIYMPIPIPISSPNESAVTVAFTYNSATGSSWLLYALAGDAPATLGAGGAQIVRDYPYQATSDVNGTATAPAAATAICTTAALPAGDYALEVEASSDDTAAIGKAVLLTQRNSGGAEVRFWSQPVPGTLTIKISRLFVADQNTFRVRSGGIAAAASFYTGNIRAYRIA